MKRIVLAGVALCSCCFAQARVDLEYHAAPPKDSKVTEEYQKKRDALRHKVWNVDNLTLANEQREAAETAERQQRNLEQQQKKQRCLRRRSKDPHREAKCYTHSF
ncbi:TPA: hypothetical protein SMI41_000602 [Serratia marcescens]|uniref:hypothetical protein n=1 Tax=Serratia marcescens TaxID=615 RepID=UPI0013D96201|nr:hypothetical protein [Serratia marcescens]ELH4244045.1 hypothetical protein [Serratia marcescens]WAY96560.1 hypothetical protein O3T13_21795 [Serratia marcescens]HEJ8067499.1 hypothetical protein [Serratia marcescens]